MKISSDLLLKVYIAVTRPPKVKYKPPRKVYNVNLYG